MLEVFSVAGISRDDCLMLGEHLFRGPLGGLRHRIADTVLDIMNRYKVSNVFLLVISLHR